MNRFTRWGVTLVALTIAAPAGAPSMFFSNATDFAGLIAREAR
jgi:hypothetical protein